MAQMKISKNGGNGEWRQGKSNSQVNNTKTIDATKAEAHKEGDRLQQMMNMQLFLTVAFLFCGVRVSEGAMSATVESGEEHCYNVIAPKGVKSTISGNFDILDDNAPPDPVGVVLYDSNMVSVISPPYFTT